MRSFVGFAGIAGLMGLTGLKGPGRQALPRGLHGEQDLTYLTRSQAKLL